MAEVFGNVTLVFVAEGFGDLDFVGGLLVVGHVGNCHAAGKFLTDLRGNCNNFFLVLFFHGFNQHLLNYLLRL